MSEPEKQKKSLDAQFHDDLRRHDDLGRVILGHIHIEEVLNELIEVMVPHPEELKDLDLSYAGKVSLVLAHGLEPKNRAPLKCLGSLRNSFAHKLDSKLDKEAVNNFYDSFDKEEKKIINRVYDSVQMEFKGKLPKRLKALPSKDKFAFYTTILKAGLDGALTEVKEKREGAG